MRDAGPCRYVVATARAPGAIAIITLIGDVLPVLAAVTGRPDWPPGRLRLATLIDSERGLAGRLDDAFAELMPHGGPRVVQRLVARLDALGLAGGAPAEVDPAMLYPEAGDRVEAIMLETLARARSPLAHTLLLDQPRRWRPTPHLAPGDEARSARLNRLVDPPVVVVVGAPNVGKSTLSNALFGRALSIALDEPGTTRDYTSGTLDLAGLVVRWYDTPGLRAAPDAIEREAIGIARRLMDRADFLIALGDRTHDWPRLSRPPDLRVAGRADLGVRGDADVVVSAVTEEGMEQLCRSVRDRLVPPADLEHPGPWRFDPRL